MELQPPLLLSQRMARVLLPTRSNLFAKPAAMLIWLTSLSMVLQWQTSTLI